MVLQLARILVNWLLLASAIVAIASGIFVDQLEIHEFPIHQWSGYAMTLFAAAHVAMHWRWRPRISRVLARPTKAEIAQESESETTDEGLDAKTPAVEGSSAPGITRRRALVSMVAGAAGVVAGWFARGQTIPDEFEGGDVGIFYHQQSSLGFSEIFEAITKSGERQGRYKDVDALAIVELPTGPPPSMPVAEALTNRRSLRDYADRNLTQGELAWLVHSANGITSNSGKRTAPSAGALYPIETYVAVDRVDDVPQGLYHVNVRDQSLEQIRSGPVAGDVMVAGLGQSFLRAAPAVFILTAVFQRTRWKYHQRHYRFVCLEAGHISQNIYLSAEAAGLGACMVASFLDGTLNNLLKIDGTEEAALGLIPVGPRN